jgi:DNA-directed RNA polymerase subunit omega
LEIIKLPIEYTDESFDSRFRLVLVVAQRARQLTEGSAPLVKARYVKNMTLALDEAIEEKLKYLTGDDAKRAREYEFRMRRERMARESMEEAAAASLEKMEEIKEAYKAETAAHAELLGAADETVAEAETEGEVPEIAEGDEE